MMGIADWIVVQIRALLASTHGFACIVGIAIGVALAETITHFLPPAMSAYAADRVGRLICFGVSAIATFAMDTSVAGFCLALLTGLAGPSLHQFGTRWLYARFPSLQPKALIP